MDAWHVHAAALHGLHHRLCRRKKRLHVLIFARQGDVCAGAVAQFGQGLGHQRALGPAEVVIYIGFCVCHGLVSGKGRAHGGVPLIFHCLQALHGFRRSIFRHPHAHHTGKTRQQQEKAHHGREKIIFQLRVALGGRGQQKLGAQRHQHQRRQFEQVQHVPPGAEHAHHQRHACNNQAQPHGKRAHAAHLARRAGRGGRLRCGGGLRRSRGPGRGPLRGLRAVHFVTHGCRPLPYPLRLPCP